MLGFHFYRLPTKLLEGKVFGRVCLLTRGYLLYNVTIIHDALDLSILGPPGDGTSLYRDPPPGRSDI